MTIAELGIIAAANGLPLTDAQLEKLSKYAELLCAKNQVVNLISRKDEENILSKHILHSLSLAFANVAKTEIPINANVFDLGTGGGLPGIPIKIARPDISITLCDSIAKKIVAVQEMATVLELENCQVITARAELLATNKQHRHKYDVVVTRAVAPLEELLRWSHGLLRQGGVLLSLKGGDLTNEIAQARNFKLAKPIEVAPLSLNGYDEFLKEEKKIVRVSMV